MFKSKKKQNTYQNKYFSVLGDSISTLQGYNPEGYKVYYQGENSGKANVIKPEDTWWGKAINELGGRLLVNNSWSGSRVTKLPEQDECFPSACSVERVTGLHKKNKRPDVILIYMGTNDWIFDANTVESLTEIESNGYEYFDSAYGDMLFRIRNNYPEAEIWCCTLCTTCMSGDPSFTFPYVYGKTHIEVFNALIRKNAKCNECKIIDFYEYNTPYDTIDGIHPNKKGMETLSEMVCSILTPHKST